MPDRPSPPPRPVEPHPLECCGRGCQPCIFDYYREALRRWQAATATAQPAGCADAGPPGGS